MVPQVLVKRLVEPVSVKRFCLSAWKGLKELGYVYGVIGGVGPREFYEKAIGATEIPGSDPGVYRDILPG